jgi:hypothetical protein
MLLLISLLADVLGWAFLNIYIPVFSPFTLIWLLTLPKTERDRHEAMKVKAFGEGQIFWAVMAMCATACYELILFRDAVEGYMKNVAVGLIIWHFATLLYALVMVGHIASKEVKKDEAKNNKSASDNSPDPVFYQYSIRAAQIIAATFVLSHMMATAAVDAKARQIKIKEEAEKAAMMNTIKCLQQLTRRPMASDCQKGEK